MRRSLQGRLFPGSVRQSLLLVVLAVLLPLLAVQTGIYVAWFHSRRASEEEANLEAARAMAATFAAFVRDVARQELAIGAALTQPSAVSAEPLNKYLTLSADEFPSIRAWHWVSAEGKVLASSEPAAIGRGVAAESYFQDMFSNRAPNQDWGVSDLLEDRAGGPPTFVIARQIVDDKKVVRGIMIAEIEAGELGDLALPLSREAEGACTVFDRKGRIAYSNLSELRTHLDWRDDDPLLVAALETKAESSGTFVSPIDGEKRIAARVPVPGIGWVVGAGRPLRAAMAGIYRGLWIPVGLNLAIGAVSAVVAAAFGRRIVRQLGRLQRHAQAVGRGDLSHRTEIAGIAELGELATAFNRMGEDLNRAREEQSQVLEAFFKHSMTCLVFLDREFNFLRVNEAYAKACRRDASEFPGHNHFEFYPHAENEAIFREVVRTKTSYQAVAKPFTFPDHPEWGTTYWDWTLVPILNAAGEVEFLIFALDDVTGRKEAERRDGFTKALLELFATKGTRKDYLDSVLEMVRQWCGCRCLGIRVVDEQSRIPYESYVGFSREFWELENWLSLKTDACACIRVILQAPEPQDAAVMTPGGSFRCDNAIQFVAGVSPEHLARYRGNCVRNGFVSLAVIPIRYHGQTLGAIHIADEREGMVPPACIEFLETMSPSIGEAIHRFNVEEQLRAAYSYARGLIEASLDPLVTISPDGAITDVNKATELATGAARDRLIGSDFSRYFTDPHRASEGYRKVLSDGLVKDYPLTIRHASGRTIDVLYNATVYRNEAGEVQGIFAAARDVTERNRAEEELAKYRQHLEELVKQRTRELARSNRELEQFAYVASHDLQEPLRVVTGYLQLIQRRYQDKIDSDADQFIHYAVDGAARMQQLITDLLNYSRVGTQGRPFAPTPVEAVVDKALVNLQAVVRDAGAAVTRDPLPTVLADETQLIQLFQNLIGNGIKFRSGRRPEIHVSARQEEGRWVFSVRDNGIGIDPQYWQQIFEIFQRLHTRQKYSGTGIGLAICKRIVERHGGRIWLDSQPGEGATFYFTI